MKTQIGTEVRDMTPEEIESHAVAFAEMEQCFAEAERKIQLRRDALSRLGMTEEEIEAFFS